MIIRQISVFVENRPGTLAEVLAVLKEHGVNMRALSVADTSDFGILRLIVNEPEKVERVLRGAKFAVKTTEVLAITVEDHPGSLLGQIEKLSSAGISVEYMYAFAAAPEQEARVVLKVDDLTRAERLICGEEGCSTPYEPSEAPGFYW
ncbi:small subunit acetolactate synthase synthase transferase acid biosynthesis iii lyase [Lucifera butyrica]|uniref:Small subunit acetolactate synthase synthase transferase acid biosynthesis iii lyase n=1 Tax=Lucifera butyrica TaxID=1351585 RepID=A0A498RCN1_9FIRM|nr:ACT domain-containing protein [Lucifera butyrica]VBB06918.1 small subunit acetolactate synthase synthase transferase acid biosynthesis iii lyase [Lucifera butyrica]